MHGHIGVGNLPIKIWLVLNIKIMWCFSFANIYVGKREGETMEGSYVVYRLTPGWGLVGLMTCRTRAVAPGILLKDSLGWLSKPAEGTRARRPFSSLGKEEMVATDSRA